MSAFAKAVSLGYRYVETDVHASRDGVLFAFHDDDLLRTCGVNAKINDLDSSEIAAIAVEGSEHIPTLSELVTTWPNLRINIDCKADLAVEPLIAAIRHHDLYDRVCIGSFSDRRLKSIREACGPRLCTSMGPKEVAMLRLRSWTKSQGRDLAPLAAQVPPRQGPLPIVDKRFVSHAHELGLHVHVWTIDDRSEMHELLDLGVDGIMTDSLATLASTLNERGQWT
ncbi:MAG: glycerophosphodiester phosphodiesterase [Actinobacteria bacterium]|nr:glycerophosphodiester phosphodiesterase [Actinomycetota bacterium]